MCAESVPPTEPNGTYSERVMFVVIQIRFMHARVANGNATQLVGVGCVLWSRVVNAAAGISLLI